MIFENSHAFAVQLDRQDPLKRYRKQFLIPKVNGKESIYFTGNSLGLQPKTAKKYVAEELTDWASFGVEGHLHSTRPWLYYHHFFKKSLAKITGAKLAEVTAMNQLTVNLHLMMVSFYRPTKNRYKIITEAGAFSSDQYALESQVKHYGLKPSKTVVELKPRRGEGHLRTDDILATIHQHRKELALVILGGVQYYTGQFFDFKRITAAGHAAGAYVGFDLAHAIGNVPMQLHKHQVDFAVWCSYKYLNSGPGGVAGAFIHERHHHKKLPRFAGWWGHQEKERFQMKKGFIPMAGVDGWQLSNFPVVSGAIQLASLKLFDEIGMKALRAKSIQLTGYAEFLLNEIDPDHRHFKILTPSNPSERGCQLSIFFKGKVGKRIFDRLSEAGVIADWREPGVIRIAPVPLYNTFEEVYRFASILKEALN